MSKETFIIDVDKAIKLYNKRTGENLDRRKLAEELGVNYQSLSNYQRGITPVFLGTLKKLFDLTGSKFCEIVKQKID